MTSENKKKIKLLLLIGALIIITVITLYILVTDNELMKLIYVSSIVIAIISVFIVFIDPVDYWKNLSIIVGFGITIIGWFANSYFNNQATIEENKNSNLNAIKNAQRDIKIKYLLNSYLIMQNASNRDDEIFENQFRYFKSIESALGSASLVGDSALVKKMNKLALSDPASKDNGMLYLDVLYQLRTDLRFELGLDSFKNSRNDAESNYNIVFFRRYLKDSMRKLDPQYFIKIEAELTQQSIDRNFNH